MVIFLPPESVAAEDPPHAVSEATADTAAATASAFCAKLLIDLSLFFLLSVPE
jgi:hypothetical protein